MIRMPADLLTNCHRGGPWSSAELRALLVMQKHGMTTKEIARITHRWERTVIFQLNRLAKTPDLIEQSGNVSEHSHRSLKKTGRWREEDHRLLFMLAEEQFTVSEIAVILGRSVWAVTHQQKLLRGTVPSPSPAIKTTRRRQSAKPKDSQLSHLPWTGDDKRLLRSMYLANASIPQIAAALNRYPAAIAKRIEKLRRTMEQEAKPDAHDLYNNHEPWTDAERKLLRDMHAHGATIESIAAALRRHPRSIEAWLKKLHNTAK